MSTVTSEVPALRYCVKCLEPSTRPGQRFDARGLCVPCGLLEDTTAADWEARRRELQEIVAWSKGRARDGYDAIIGVSGGKDSTRLALFAREIGLTPLLVSCTYPPRQITERGVANLSNLVSLGFDLITVNIAPEVYRINQVRAFHEHGNFMRPSELALYSSVVKLAIDWKIPLVCYGENPFLRLGIGIDSRDGNAEKLTTMHTLGGGDLSPYLDSGVALEQLHWYSYPTPAEIAAWAGKMIFLGYYMEDFHDLVNAKIAIANGLKTRNGRHADPALTGSIYNFSALDDDFVIVNQYFKYLKLGFGLVSQDCSLRIRDGLMTRAEAIDLVEKYDGKCDEFYKRRFCEYLGISRATFDEAVERFRNPDLWIKEGNGEWRLKYPPK